MTDTPHTIPATEAELGNAMCPRCGSVFPAPELFAAGVAAERQRIAEELRQHTATCRIVDLEWAERMIERWQPDLLDGGDRP